MRKKRKKEQRVLEERSKKLPNKSPGVLTIYWGSYPFMNKTFKDFSRTFKAIFPTFQWTQFSAKKGLQSLSFSLLSQHE